MCARIGWSPNLVSLQNVLTDRSARKSSSLRGRYRRSDIRAGEVVRLIDEVPEFSLKATLTPHQAKRFQFADQDRESTVEARTAFPTSWWIAVKSTGGRSHPGE